tara:strand:- start:496 stop:951 length:456 start_codon:yes stop_codon:yes gene_type:complete
MNYAINYLSKYNSSKKNLERVLKNKIARSNIEKKIKYDLYNSISEIITTIENNKLIDDNVYTLSKIRSYANQGKSKLFIKNYLLQKGVDKNVISNSIETYQNQNPNWEIESAIIFINKKKLIKSSENYQKNLNKMSRAGFIYEICKNILKN